MQSPQKKKRIRAERRLGVKTQQDSNICCLSPEGLTLAHAEPPPPPAENSTSVFKELRMKWTMRKFLNKFRSAIVKQKQADSMAAQQWEKTIESAPKTSEPLRFVLRSSSSLYFWLNLAIAASDAILLWLITLDLVYDGVPLGNWSWLFAISLITLIVHVAVSLNTAGTGGANQTRREIIINYLSRSAYFDCYSLAFLLASMVGCSDQTRWGLELGQCLVLIVQLTRKVRVLRPFLYLFKEMVLVESFLLLFTTGHLFAIGLFLSSRLNSERNWLMPLQIHLKPWWSQYIYSLYWAITTIVTVGYGDITPQNEYEILVTIAIEVVGAAVFGYLINIIGMTMAQLKKQDQTLEEELSVANKLIKCMGLRDDLAHRFRQFLKDNQKADTTFTIKDEKKILDKLKPTLRNEILQVAHTKLIKKSIFFLTNFSKALQDFIAMKLVKRVLQPNEVLSTQIDNHSIYVVEQGTVEVHFVKRHHQRPISKLLRSIVQEPNHHSIISNVYGWSELILGRKLNLLAISKQFTVGYELSKEDFAQAIQQHPLDFEVVCELRDVVQLTPHPQSYEGPSLIQNSFHYVPLKCLVIKKYVHSNLQRRREFVKRQRNIRNKSIMHVRKPDKETLSKQSIARRVSSLMSEHGLLDETASHQYRNHDNEQVGIAYLTVSHNFEVMKNYTKYFPQWNMTTVVQRYNQKQHTVHENFIQRVVVTTDNTSRIL